MKYKLLRFSLIAFVAMLWGTAFADHVTMEYTGGTTTNMTCDGNEAATFGLNADEWSVTGNKGSSNNAPGLNAAGDFRLYYNANGSNTITVSSLTGATINSISITFTANSYSNVSVTVDGTDVTGQDGAWDINSSSFVLGNANTSNTQVRIKSIVINYTSAGGQTDTRAATAIELGEATTSAEVGATVALPTFTVKAGDTAIEGATVTWSSTNETVAKIEEGQIKALAAGTTTITASYAGNETNYKASSASFTLTVTAAPYTSIAAMLEDVTATKTDIQYNFENLLVTYVIGKYTYVNDGVSNMLLFGSDLGLTAGDKVSGSVKGQLYTYNGLPEIALNASDIQITVASSNNEVLPTVVEVAQLGVNYNNYITIKNATYVSANKKNLYFKVGEEDLVVYNQFSITLAETDTIAGKAYDITGFGGCYNTTQQIFPVKIVEAVAEESGCLYSWNAGTETGGTAVASNGTDVGAANGPYSSVIIISGKTDFSTNTVTITLDKALMTGDKIAITAYRNKNAADKQSGVLMKFDKGGTVSTASTGLEFVNIDTSDASAEDSNRGTEPNTVILTVPAEADGSTIITMTRAKTQTNLFVTKIEITGERSGDEPGDEPTDQPALPLTATWDFQNLIPASIADVNIQGNNTAKVASDVEGVELTVISEGGKLQYNASGYAQFNTNTTIQVPVRNSGDEVTVVSYPGQSNYTVGGEDATGQNEFTHMANASEKAQGYVEIIASKTAYIYSIKVLQKAQIQEKLLYSTDFSEWTAAKAATSESKVTWTTKYSKEQLDFMIYNTAIFSCSDTKFSSYTELPHMSLQAAKAADPYVKTSKLASVTKVRFIHGATGNNRGWKLEAKGDGDADWVVLSDTPANPASWCEVTAEVNRTNVELRWTNLTNNQNAYMFELDIYGNVDMGNTPALGTFKVNGDTYVAGDIFAEQNDGSMAATIELSKSAPMVSATNPLTDLVADNGQIGEVSYSGNETSCTVTIPVTLGATTLNYIATFVQKPDFTLTYYNTDGTAMGTQEVEKDAAIGAFAYDFSTATAAEGKKVRGWFAAADGGRKFTTADVITANTALYAVQTPIEVQSPNERYTFALNDQYFYAEDHEAFEPVGSGKFHDATHGWAFANGDKVNLLVGGNANIVLYLCNYSSETAITLTNAAEAEVAKIENAKVTTDGAVQTLSYTGEAGIVTLNFSGTCYVHKLVIANQAEPLYTYDAETKTYSVVAGKTAGLLGALDMANGSGNATIYLPNGTYDLGNECLTTISGQNITIKGESQEGVIIQNLPKAEGIGVTATLLNTSNYLTLEKLTLKNAYPYYDPNTGKAAASAGRAVCLQDKGNYTVCRNVTMLSYQDTYYSNNTNGQFYFKDCEIHGLVDFVCGGGDVFFENTTFYLESREATEGVGDVTIAAPNGAKEFGYVMDSCVVDCHSKTFNWGRSWGSFSGLVWMNTTLKQPSAIVPSRFTAAGMNSAADGFYEYNTLDEAGNTISPASNIIKFTHSSGNKEYETILTAEQAAGYAKDKVFADAPDEFKDRVGLNDGPTAISTAVKTTTQSDVIYNLQGVRVQKADKGLYIINGKKVMVK